MASTTDRTKGLWLYFILTLVLMLASWGLMAILQIPGASTDPAAPPVSPVGLILLFVGGFSPSIAGVIATWRVGGGAGLRSLWKSAVQFALGRKAYAVILLVPLLDVGLRAAVQAIQGGSAGQSLLITQPLRLIGFTIQIFFLGPISEEFGWRGFALGRLLSKWSAARASLLLGVLWSLWHLPLFFIPNTVQHGYGAWLPEFLIFLAMTTGATFLYTWLYLETNGSLWSAILFHFTANYSKSFWATFGDDGLTGRLISAGLWIVIAMVIAASWSKRPAMSLAPSQ